jgi:hypothetical protein
MTIISVQNLLAKCHFIKFLHVIKFWRPLYLPCFHLNRMGIGNGNDDIASEEHFENSKTRRGSHLGL